MNYGHYTMHIVFIWIMSVRWADTSTQQQQQQQRKTHKINARHEIGWKHCVWSREFFEPFLTLSTSRHTKYQLIQRRRICIANNKHLNMRRFYLYLRRYESTVYVYDDTWYRYSCVGPTAHYLHFVYFFRSRWSSPKSLSKNATEHRNEIGE